jgi:hypothetical protein
MFYIGFGILRVVVMTSSIFWDILSCKESSACCGLLLGLLFDPEDEGNMFFQNVG